MTYQEEYVLELIESGIENCRACLAVNQECLDFLTEKPRSVEEYVEWRTERAFAPNLRTLRRIGIDAVIERTEFAKDCLKIAIRRMS